MREICIVSYRKRLSTVWLTWLNDPEEKEKNDQNQDTAQQKCVSAA